MGEKSNEQIIQILLNSNKRLEIHWVNETATNKHYRILPLYDMSWPDFIEANQFGKWKV